MSGKLVKPGKKQAKGDDEALKEFCDQVDFEDVDFETWQEAVETLDIVVPFFIESDEAQCGCSRTLKFTRKVDGKKKSHIIELEIPANVKDCHELVLEQLGDQMDCKVGDLKVLIRIKRGS